MLLINMYFKLNPSVHILCMCMYALLADVHIASYSYCRLLRIYSTKVRAATIPNFTNISSSKCCCLMYLATSKSTDTGNTLNCTIILHHLA